MSDLLTDLLSDLFVDSWGTGTLGVLEDDLKTRGERKP
jgi:hypothetical protein